MTDHWPPTANNMPDLSHLDNPLTLTLIFKALIFKAGYTNPIAQALWTHFARRMAYAVGEYIQTRRILGKFVADPDDGVMRLFTATAHMETCLVAMQKAFRFARRLRKQRDFPHAGALTVLSEPVSEKLDTLIESMEDLERATQNRNIDEETPMMLMLKANGVEAGGCSISYREIAFWLEELCQLATYLTDYRETANEP